jgi:hypothetical protein
MAAGSPRAMDDRGGLQRICGVPPKSWPRSAVAIRPTHTRAAACVYHTSPSRVTCLSLSLHLHSPHIVAPSTNSRRGYKPSLRVYPLDTPRSSVRQQRQPERATWSKRSPIAIPNSSPLPLPLKIGTEHATSKQLPLYGGESL